jgi:hypothetical protein
MGRNGRREEFVMALQCASFAEKIVQCRVTEAGIGPFLTLGSENPLHN